MNNFSEIKLLIINLEKNFNNQLSKNELLKETNKKIENKNKEFIKLLNDSNLKIKNLEKIIKLKNEEIDKLLKSCNQSIENIREELEIKKQELNKKNTLLEKKKKKKKLWKKSISFTKLLSKVKNKK